MKNRLLRILSAFPLILPVLLILFLCPGCRTSDALPAEGNEDASVSLPSAERIPLAQDGKTGFLLVYDVDVPPEVRNQIFAVRDVFASRFGADLRPYDDYQKEQPFEIVVGSERRESCRALTGSLAPGEYAIKVSRTAQKTEILLAYRGAYARGATIDRFVAECENAAGGDGSIPADLEIKGEYTVENAMITSTIPQLRDPFVLQENGTYYAYGTGWHCWKNTSGSLAGPWTDIGLCVDVPEDAETNHWAPEVHRYNGKFYMFTTYYSAKRKHRGCTVFCADTPEGPFCEISDGPVTPADWDSIDGTFYVDTDRQPWMIFVHEWTSTDDGVGRMAAAKMSDDLTRLISEPVELFRADDPSWATNKVTDGCFMVTLSDGTLLMLWSNWDSAGYCVGIARSDNGRVDGKWSQDKALLFSKNLTDDYDGGHGMIFADTAGDLWLSLHSPNNASDGRKETPVFIPVKESGSTLVWDRTRDLAGR